MLNDQMFCSADLLPKVGELGRLFGHVCNTWGFVSVLMVLIWSNENAAVIFSTKSSKEI